MENFSMFYEQGVVITWSGLSVVATLLILGRLGQLFFRYINTGEVGRFYDSCYVYHLMEGDGFDLRYSKLLYNGTHPGAIALDLAGYTAIILFAGLVWIPLIIILPLVGVAFLLRRKIAKKQEFVAKLDGTHPDMQGNGSSEDQASMTQSYTGGP